MTVYAITDTKKGEQGLRLLIFKLPCNLMFYVMFCLFVLFISFLIVLLCNCL